MSAEDSKFRGKGTRDLVEAASGFRVAGMGDRREDRGRIFRQGL